MARDFINPELHLALQRLCERMLQVLKEIGLTTKDFRPVLAVKTSKGSTTISHEPKPNWAALVSQHWARIAETEELRRASEMLFSLPAVHKHVRLLNSRGDGLPLTHEDISRIIEEQIIKIFLWNFLETVNFPDSWSARFEDVYLYWEEHLLTGVHTLRSISILWAFRGPKEPIELETGLIIRRATDTDFADIANRQGGQSHSFGRGFSVLELEYRVRKEEGTSHDVGINRLNRVLTALRLTKKGDVHVTDILTHPKGDITRWGHSQLPAPQSANVYELTTNEEIARLREIWGFYNSIQLAPVMDFAIRRFNFGYERWRTEDRITDHVIGLETLYVPDGSAGEIGYKLQTRAAALLGKDLSFQGRSSIKKGFRVAYRIRNMLVHGVPEPKRLSKELAKLGLTREDELSALIEGFLRDSIMQFLRNRELLNPEALDNIVLRLEGRKNTSHLQPIIDNSQGP